MNSQTDKENDNITKKRKGEDPLESTMIMDDSADGLTFFRNQFPSSTLLNSDLSPSSTDQALLDEAFKDDLKKFSHEYFRRRKDIEEAVKTAAKMQEIVSRDEIPKSMTIQKLSLPAECKTYESELAMEEKKFQSTRISILQKARVSHVDTLKTKLSAFQDETLSVWTKKIETIFKDTAPDNQITAFAKIWSIKILQDAMRHGQIKLNIDKLTTAKKAEAAAASANLTDEAKENALKNKNDSVRAIVQQEIKNALKKTQAQHTSQNRQGLGQQAKSKSQKSQKNLGNRQGSIPQSKKANPAQKNVLTKAGSDQTQLQGKPKNSQKHPTQKNSRGSYSGTVDAPQSNVAEKTNQHGNNRRQNAQNSAPAEATRPHGRNSLGSKNARQNNRNSKQ